MCIYIFWYENMYMYAVLMYDCMSMNMMVMYEWYYYLLFFVLLEWVSSTQTRLTWKMDSCLYNVVIARVVEKSAKMITRSKLWVEIIRQIALISVMLPVIIIISDNSL